MIERASEALITRSRGSIAGDNKKQRIHNKHQFTLNLIRSYYWTFDEAKDASSILEVFFLVHFSNDCHIVYGDY